MSPCGPCSAGKICVVLVVVSFLPSIPGAAGCSAAQPFHMIPDDRNLLANLTGVEYGYVLREGRDAIMALTFAYPVGAPPRHQYQYNPLNHAWSGRP